MLTDLGDFSNQREHGKKRQELGIEPVAKPVGCPKNRSVNLDGLGKGCELLGFS